MTRSVWDEGDSTPVVARGPCRLPAIVAVWLAWVTSPPVLGTLVLVGHYILAERPSPTKVVFLYVFALPSALQGFVATAIAYPLNTSPVATYERSICRHALRVNVFTVVCNVALFFLALIWMAAAWNANED